MKILVVTSEAISAEQLRSAVGVQEAQGAEILVVAPALQSSGLRFWMSDVDGAIERAQRVQHETVDELNDGGLQARGDTGEGDLIEAIGDALTTFPADRILLFGPSRGEGGKGGGPGDVNAEELRERFPVPVQLAATGAH